MTADLSATFQHIALSHVEDRVARAMYYFENEIYLSSIPDIVHNNNNNEKSNSNNNDSNVQELTLVVVGGVAVL